MEYNKIQNTLQEYISFFEMNKVDSVKWNEYRNLEKIYKNNNLLKELKSRAEYLHKWMYNIDKKVFKSKGGWNYIRVSELEDLDLFNKHGFDIEHELTFTKEMFERLCVDYVNYQIQRLTEQLVEREITSNSTCKISNLVFEWNLECTQKLIKIFKDLL